MLKNRKKGLRTMSKLFMHGTSLEGIEQLVVIVPNFQPRRSGIVIVNVSKGLDKCGYICSDFKTNVDKKNIKT